MSPMACSCGSDYFAQSPIFQTNHDGRGNYMAFDIRFPWIHHLTCVSCGKRWLADAEPGGKKALVPAESDEARALMDGNRIDFTKSFDPRQHGKSVAS